MHSVTIVSIFSIVGMLGQSGKFDKRQLTSAVFCAWTSDIRVMMNVFSNIPALVGQPVFPLA
jgi:hypothetical protein